MKVVKTLYVVSAWDTENWTPVHMTFLYAQTRAKAVERGRAWRDECYPHLQHVEVHHHPDGFHWIRSRLPGKVEVTEGEEAVEGG